MSEEMVTVTKSDLEFVRAYCEALEGMKTLLTRERDEARTELERLNGEIARLRQHVAELTKQRDEEHGLARKRIAELEARPEAEEVLQRVISQYEAKTMSAAENELLQDIVRRISNLTGPKKPTKPLVCPICHTIENHPVYTIETFPPSYEVKFCNGTKATFEEDPRKLDAIKASLTGPKKPTKPAFEEYEDGHK